MDCRNIAHEVYGLAYSDDPIAPMVREALEVIDCGLDTHGWVRAFCASLAYRIT